MTPFKNKGFEYYNKVMMIIGDSTAHSGHAFHPNCAVASAAIEDEDDNGSEDFEYLDDTPSMCMQSSLLPLLLPHSLWTLNPTQTPSPHHQASLLHPHSSAASSPLMIWWMWTQQCHPLMFFLMLQLWGQMETNIHHCFSPPPSLHSQISQIVHHCQTIPYWISCWTTPHHTLHWITFHYST